MNGMIKYFLLILSLAFITQSCEDIFHEEDFRYSVINTKEDLENLTNGVHKFLYEGRYIMQYQFDAYLKNDLYYSYYIRQKNMPAKYFGHEEASRNFQLQPSWYLLYAAIASANNILTQYKKGHLTKPEYKALVGENYFYRAYCYFWLTRVYGEVPLVKDIDVSYTIEKPLVKEVYESIEQDLLTAISMLTTEARIKYVTPHSGTSKALLAELYMAWAGFPVKDESKYLLAAEYAEDVIDNADVYGYKLLPDYSDVWNNENMFHDEIIFTIRGRIQGYKDIYNPAHNYMGTIEIDNIYSLRVDIGASSIFYNTFPRDYRRDITFFNHIYVHQNYIGRKLDTGYHYIDTANVRFIVGYRKFYWETDVEQYEYKPIGSKKQIILRYPHMLLTYAEAVARSGEITDKAYECINMIRRRANKVDLHSESVYDLEKGLSATAFIDSVLAERTWELCGEASDRWFVLLRTEKLAAVFQDNIDQGVYRGSVPESFFVEKPAFDVNLNPGIE
jgi:starch-binding outer membrane protein, SusD/RagB family